MTTHIFSTVGRWIAPLVLAAATFCGTLGASSVASAQERGRERGAEEGRRDQGEGARRGWAEGGRGGAIKGAITAVALVARDATGVRPSDT